MPQNSSISDFVPVADWLTKDYIRNVLQKYYKDEALKVIDAVYTPATAKGENFTSVMFRASVKFQCKSDSELHERKYVIKMPLDDEFSNNLIAQYDVYKKEMDFYKNIAGALTKLLREIGDDEKLFAEVIFVDYDHGAIIFEDLTVNNFILANRLIGLDMEHIKMVLRKLAKMHATSAVLNQRTSGTLEKYDRGLLNRRTDAFRPFFEGNLLACGNMMCELGEEFKKYGEKLLKLKPVFMEYGQRVFDVNENYFNALVHGDLWTNNVLFTYDEKGNPTDGVMIDFQYTCWGSPAIDLHYFFNTSLVEEIRLYYQEELVQFYHIVLVETLKKLGFKGIIPSLHQFWIELTDRGFYAFSSACITQPIMVNNKTENADFNALMSEDERALNFRRTIYANEQVQRNLKRLIPIFDRRGLLDIQ